MKKKMLAMKRKTQNDHPEFKKLTIELGYDELVWLAIAFKWAYKWVGRDNRPDNDNGNPDSYMPYIHGVREHVLAQLDEPAAQMMWLKTLT